MRFLLLCLIGPIAAFAHPNLRERQIVDHVKQSIRLAEFDASQLSRPILDLEGFSSYKIRHLLNNLCSIKGATYLEIGYWKAATVVAAAYRNERRLAEIATINEWLQFKSAKLDLTHLNHHYLHKPIIKFTATNWRALDFPQFFHRPIFIFFHDNKSDLENVFCFFHPFFNDLFITVIGDWNWERTRIETRHAFQKLGYKVLFQRELFSSGFEKKGWWNGIYVAVIKK